MYTGVKFLLAQKQGCFQGLSGYNDGVFEIGGLDQIMFELPLGAQISLPPKSFTSQRVAAVLAHGSTHQNVGETLLTAERTLSIKII